MSDDLIKRSDAIRALNREKSDWNLDYNVPIDNCIKRLKKVHSADRPSTVDLSSVYSTAYKSGYEKGKADRPQGWIPCSERLPDEKEGVYLICTDYGYLCSCRWTNDVYGLGATKWSAWGWHRIDLPQYSYPVAWMDLKPWKGADDDNA